MNADLSSTDDSDSVAPHAGGGALEGRYLAFLEFRPAGLVNARSNSWPIVMCGNHAALWFKESYIALTTTRARESPRT
jgi:hypothetical protein